MVTRMGIEASPEQIKAIFELKSPTNVKDVQKLTDRVAALNRFISRSSNRCRLFYDVLRKNKGFNWIEKHENALAELKNYLTTSPLLAKPKRGEAFYVYFSVTDQDVGVILNPRRCRRPISCLLRKQELSGCTNKVHIS